MKKINFSLIFIFLILLFIGERIEAQGMDNPPPPDSLCMVFSGIDYGGYESSPQNYPNAKHITNVKVGSYYFPVVIWETGGSWSNQSLFSYWDDMFKFWSYPDSFTSNNGQDTGRGNVCVDSKGNLHFVWHQAGSPDGYEIFYSRAILDTSAGIIQYNVERPAVMISATNGEMELFPAMAIYGDTLIMVVFNVGPIYEEHTVGYNYSTDGGNSWVGRDIAYEHGTSMTGDWILPSIAPDPNTGDMWVALNFDDSGDDQIDVVSLYYDAIGNIWTKEVLVSSSIEWAYSLPVICVDFFGNPSIVFLKIYNPGGGGIPPFPERLSGILVFTRRETGGWSSPVEIGFPESGPTNALSGFPSAGITQENEIYITCTQPDSASPDTGAYWPFNVYYWKINPELGMFSVPRTKVSEIPWGSSMNTIYPHIVYNIPTDSSDGPGITWCQMESCVPPADVYYKQMHQLVGIKQTENPKLEILNPKLTAYPNPFTNTTHISLSFPSIGQRAEGKGQRVKNIGLKIYDLSGRLVKDFSLGTGHSSLVTVVSWDGRDDSGRRVRSGVYFVNLKVGEKMLTKKLILLE